MIGFSPVVRCSLGGDAPPGRIPVRARVAFLPEIAPRAAWRTWAAATGADGKALQAFAVGFPKVCVGFPLVFVGVP